MKINLWYNGGVKQWRWTLSSDKFLQIQESGNSKELRAAMDDIANTVEWILDKDLNV